MQGFPIPAIVASSSAVVPPDTNRGVACDEAAYDIGWNQLILALLQFTHCSIGGTDVFGISCEIQ